MEYLGKSIWIGYVVAGTLLGIGFVYPVLWVLGIVGAAYFLYLVQLEQTFKKASLGGWLVFSIKAAAPMLWIWSTYPIDWLPVELGKIEVPLIFVYWLTSSLWIGVGGIVIVALIRLFKEYVFRKTLLALLLPAIWIAGEVVGSIAFSIMTLWPGSEVSAKLSFGYVGFLLVENDLLLNAAGLAGVYSLSFLFVLLAIGLLLLIKKLPSNYRYLSLGFLLLLIVPFSSQDSSFQVEGESAYEIAVIETNFPTKLLRSADGVSDISSSLAEAMSVSLEYGPDYVLLPEDSRFFNQEKGNGFVQSFFKFQYGDPSAVIVDSGRVEIDDSVYLQAFVYDGLNKEAETFQKNYLAPQGEYVPYLYAGAFYLFGFGDVIDGVAKDVAYKMGVDSKQSDLGVSLPGVLFCFESVDPAGVRRLVGERPDLPFVAHPVSHAWFHEPEVLWHQLDVMLRVQAVWNKKYIVSASSHAESKTYTPSGKIVVSDIVAEGEYWKVRVVKIPK